MTGKEIKQPYTVAQEHEPWPEQVQDDFLAACDENLYLASMKRSQYDGTHIVLTQQKDRSKTPMTIKAPKVLRDVLAKARKSNSSEYLLTHKWGRPYSVQSLSLRIRETLRRIGHGEYTTHGLRKNAGIMLAENGATVPQIMAALGHKTPKMALYYCRLANQKLLAEQASEILDLAFAKRGEQREAKATAEVAANRARLKLVR
jgi:integrase